MFESVINSDQIWVSRSGCGKSPYCLSVHCSTPGQVVELYRLQLQYYQGVGDLITDVARYRFRDGSIKRAITGSLRKLQVTELGRRTASRCRSKLLEKFSIRMAYSNLY